MKPESQWVEVPQDLMYDILLYLKVETGELSKSVAHRLSYNSNPYRLSPHSLLQRLFDVGIKQ